MSSAGEALFVPRVEWVDLKPLRDRPTEHHARPYVRLFYKSFTRAFVLASLFIIVALYVFFLSLGGEFSWPVRVWEQWSRQDRIAVIWGLGGIWVFSVLPISLTWALARVWTERSERRLAATPLQNSRYKFIWAYDRTDELWSVEVWRDIDNTMILQIQDHDQQSAQRQARKACWQDAEERKLFLRGELPILLRS